MLRKKPFFVFLMLLMVCSLQAIELTKVAVVNMGRIVDAYFREAAGVKEISDLKSQYQLYLNKVGLQLADLKEQMVKAQLDENQPLEISLRAEIEEKERLLREYHGIMTEKIRNIKMSSQANNDFERNLQRAIQSVAIEKGFSVVLEDGVDILWYDREDVDITDLVIDRLSGR